MPHDGPSARPETAQVPPAWTEAAFDALDMAAAVFDDRLELCAINSAGRQRFGAGMQGADATSVLGTLVNGSHEHRIAHYSDRDLVGLVRSYVREYELPRDDRDPLLLTSTPTREGGFLVTLRDPDRGRIVEERALELLRNSIEVVDMGMMVWDAGLIVRVANEAWARHLVPAAPGEPMEVIGRRLKQRGITRPRRGKTHEETFTEIVIESHRNHRRWEVRHEDGRVVRISTFPTQSGGVLAVAFDVSDRQDVEAQARRLIADAIESLGDGVLLLDGHLRSLMLNRAFLGLFLDPSHPLQPGTTATELFRLSIAQGRTEVPDGLTAEALVERMKEAIVTCEKNLPTTHAGGRVVETTAYPTAMGGYVIVSRDVTERVRTEATLRETEARTRTIVESLGEGVALYDADLRLEMNNPAFRRLVFDGKDLSPPGTHIVDEIRAAIAHGTLDVPPEEEQAALDWMLDCITGHKAEVEMPISGGRTLEASNFGTPQGGYLILMRDVTARKAAERATREADELVRTIVDASPTTFLVTRLEDGKVIYAPALSRERYGNIETARSFFLAPEDRERYIAALRQTGSLTDYPVRFRRQDGSIMDGLTSARIIDFRGETLIVSSTRDITEQLAMQSELERQRELAHQNEKLTALGGLLAGVAHELNNPLSIVVANAMMLEEDIDDPVLRRRVERVASAAKRSGRIVKTFLAMARNRPMRVETAAVNEVVETAIEISAYGLKAAGTDIVLDLDPGNPAAAMDADQIIQVLSNLIINSEYVLVDLGDAGRLRIVTRDCGDSIRIEVHDNGPGVPEELRNRIFEPYFTTKEVGKGTGVGLAFCHRVVTAHGGKIEVGAGEAGGAVFTILLPRDHARAIADPELGPTDPAAAAHVLVLDDEPDVAATVADALMRGGYRVTTVTSAAAAADACAATRFDAILSDVRMPGTDGLAFLDDLRRRDPPLAGRLAFMTGDGIGQSSEGGLQATGRPFLEKPAEPDDILRLVAQLIKETRDGA